VGQNRKYSQRANDFRSSPTNGHWRARRACPSRAICRLMQRSKERIRDARISSIADIMLRCHERSKRIRCRHYVGGGMKRHSTVTSANGSESECCKQICIRPSFDSRLGRSSGTMAAPFLEVTIISGLPPPAGMNQFTLSTKAQFFPLQHSCGYQSCERAGAQQRRMAKAKSETATRDETRYRTSARLRSCQGIG
jgi:hypothetical protein